VKRTSFKTGGRSPRWSPDSSQNRSSAPRELSAMNSLVSTTRTR
jgi:hypothetical protein